MKKRATEKRNENHKKHKAMKSIQYDFNVTSIANKESFMKYDSYRRNVIQHAAINKGYMEFAVTS